VKALFSDREFNAKHRLGAVNSINWARILAQTVYYFLSYFHVKRSLSNSSSEIQYVVPTGNFGDVLAGFYAKRMGLPMAPLVVATNSNDILVRFWKTGRYEKIEQNPSHTEEIGAAEPAAGASDGKQAVGNVKETLSPAMDILVSSNFERLLWYLAYEAEGAEGLDADRRKRASSALDGWMSKVKSDGRVEVPTAVLTAAKRDFIAERVSDTEVHLLDLMARTACSRKCTDLGRHQALLWEQRCLCRRSSHCSRAVCRTAHHRSQVRTLSNLRTILLIAHFHFSLPTTVQVVLATAHPAKFSDAVEQALSTQQSFNFDRDVLPDELRGLLEKEKRVIDVEGPDVDLVKRVIESFAESRGLDGPENASV
jgi:threonine synthase